LSTSDSDENSDFDSGSNVEITLSNTDAKKTDAGIEEGEIAGGSGIAAAEESRENLAGVQAGPEDLVKLGTCFMDRSLMTQADLDALVSDSCFSFESCRLPGREMTPKPRSNESCVSRLLYCGAATASIEEVR
jgi:hypothetical protein